MIKSMGTENIIGQMDVVLRGNGFTERGKVKDD
jgi:hypothetical protein